MKTLFAAGVLTSLLLSGCSRKADAELRARVNQLEAEQKLTAQALNDLLAQTKSYQGQTEKMLSDIRVALLSQSSNVDNVGQVFLDHLRNRELHSRTGPVATNALPPLTREGVPLAVYNGIALQAIKQWPRNYSRQDSYIRAELEKYKKLHR